MRTTLYDIRWETYERLLADLQNSSAPRLTYDQGMLEIMSPLEEHERYNRSISLLVEEIAVEWGLDIENLGSRTFKREDLARGFEPDSCFYIQNAERIHGKIPVDLTVDPPPDLIIEIDITSPSVPKLPLYAQLGVPEVWRYDGRTLTILTLTGGVYHESDESVALPGLDRATLSAFMQDSISLKRTEWVRKLRDWARRHGPHLNP
jgi:Uma2 family endonuclease